jgi:16S rRNA (adenine1518-N6/adenine1519-N6)-dimethyltransferase
MYNQDNDFVRAKKYLGQHFLKDKNIASNIADSLGNWNSNVLEIGPGMGILTQYIKTKCIRLKVVELDRDSVSYLIKNEIVNSDDIIEADFLKLDISQIFGGQNYAIIGNFPYNISSQIVFKVLENRNIIPFFSGMFQKEVAERIATPSGSKVYGILSVLCQAFYEVEYLFSVPPTVFIPPPNVMSGVISLKRKDNFKLKCDEELYFNLVKTSFNTRRKMLRVSLKTYISDLSLLENPIFTKRPEQLSFSEFEQLTLLIQNQNIKN